MSEQGEINIYDFEGQIEGAVKLVLTENELTAVIPENSTALQKERIRVEFDFQTGSAKQSYHVVTVDGVQMKLNASYTGTGTCTIIAPSGDSENGSSAIHRAYRARIRRLFGNLTETLNGNNAAGDRYLPYHQIQNVIESGTSGLYKAQEGYEMSKIQFRFEFGVIQSAWAELNATT